MEKLTLREIEQRYHQLVAEGDYEAALEWASAYAYEFPPHGKQVVYYWRFSLAARLGRAEQALGLMDEALTAGHWYADLESDEDFIALRDLPAFKQIVALCRERREEAIRTAVPVLKTILPAGDFSKPYPWLMALHGNGSNVERAAKNWAGVADLGWLVALPQSPHEYAPEWYSWNDWDWAIRSLKKQYAELVENYPVDPDRLVLAGFSMGAGLATYLAVSQTIVPVRGVIAVAPFLPDPEVLRPFLEEGRAAGLRVYLVASAGDEYCLQIARQLAEMLPPYCLACHLQVYPDQEHTFPPSFEQALSEALDFVLPHE
jgi:predicted esterase